MWPHTAHCPRHPPGPARTNAFVDHAGQVRTRPLPGFDLDRTIFKTLQSPLARFVMTRRLALDVLWDDAAARRVQADYVASAGAHPLPPASATLIRPPRFLLKGNNSVCRDRARAAKVCGVGERSSQREVRARPSRQVAGSPWPTSQPALPRRLCQP